MQEKRQTRRASEEAFESSRGWDDCIIPTIASRLYVTHVLGLLELSFENAVSFGVQSYLFAKFDEVAHRHRVLSAIDFRSYELAIRFREVAASSKRDDMIER